MQLVDRDLTPQANALAREWLQQLESALSQLSADDQQVIRLRNWDRASFAESAAA